MGKWQKSEGQGVDIKYIIALNEGFAQGQMEPPTAANLVELAEAIDVYADAWLLDPEGRYTGVASFYCEYEPSMDCSASVNVVLDEDMRIHFIGATHENDGVLALDVLYDVATD